MAECTFSIRRQNSDKVNSFQWALSYRYQRDKRFA